MKVNKAIRQEALSMARLDISNENITKYDQYIAYQKQKHAKRGFFERVFSKPNVKSYEWFCLLPQNRLSEERIKSYYGKAKMKNKKNKRTVKSKRCPVCGSKKDKKQEPCWFEDNTLSIVDLYASTDTSHHSCDGWYNGDCLACKPCYDSCMNKVQDRRSCLL